MLVTFKCITQETFALDLSEALTIGEVKKEVASSKGDNFATADQKLIYNGKVLTDDSVLKDIGYDEKKFMVLIVKKPAPPADPEPPKEVTAAVPETPANRAPPVDTPAAPRRPIAPAIPAEQQSKLNDLVAMGYPESEASVALRAAYFNADRAVEYLLSGIPDAVRQELDLDGGEGDEEQGPGGLDFLMHNEQFAQLRNLVRDNPEALPQLIQQIATDNPQLMQLIRENEQQFLDILNAEGDDSDIAENVGGEAHAPEAPFPPNVIQITETDRDAINRLKDMGFPQDLVIEAYFACDKNEGLAVNYILARMEEAYDDPDQSSQ
ncbi:hypothetical protein FO519_001366 [Halicephalobus sp. NKZ332]|nr:hypothetical protein FO519_001366 [Halicephalobus sp. NKZ332]